MFSLLFNYKLNALFFASNITWWREGDRRMRSLGTHRLQCLNLGPRFKGSRWVWKAEWAERTGVSTRTGLKSRESVHRENNTEYRVPCPVGLDRRVQEANTLSTRLKIISEFLAELPNALNKKPDLTLLSVKNCFILAVKKM